jgi:hypothetical protein
MNTLISWQVAIESGANEVVVTADGVTETLAIPVGSYWGVKYSGLTPSEPSSDSISGAFATMLAAHSKITSVTAVYDFTPSVGASLPATVYNITMVSGTTGSVDWTDVASTLPSTNVGWDGSYDPTWSAVVSLTNTQNGAGYWRPGVGSDNVMDLRSTEMVGSQSVAASANTADAFHTRVLGEVERGVLIYDAVDDAYIRLYRTLDSTGSFPTVAGRGFGDENNLLYHLIVAAANNATFMVWRDEELQFNCKINPPWSLSAMTTAIGGSGARYSVTIRHTVVA